VRPYPHVVLDDFLEPAAAVAAFARFPPLAAMSALKSFRYAKAQDPLLDKFDPLFRALIFDHLHSERFLRFVGALTGVAGLKADPQLYTAGLAQGGDGSFLSVHIDNSSHPVRPWYRRVNLLLYLNRHWDEAKGGHFELWDRGMADGAAVLPGFNRAVLFLASPQSWHGYRRVVAPDGDTRKSINLFYYTEQSPTGADYYHVTSYRPRPGQPP